MHFVLVFMTGSSAARTCVRTPHVRLQAQPLTYNHYRYVESGVQSRVELLSKHDTRLPTFVLLKISHL